MIKVARSAPGGQLVAVARNAFALLDRRERRHALMLILGLIITGLVDAVALASVMPVVTIIVEPGVLERYQVLTVLRNVFPEITLNQFVISAVFSAGLLLTLSAGLGYAMLWASNRFGAAIQTRLAHDIMLGALHAPYSWHLNQNSAALVRFFHSGIDRWGRDFVLRLITMTQYLIGMIVPLVLMLVMAPGTGTLSLVLVAAVGILLTRLVQPRIKRAASSSKEASDRLVVVANNALAGVKDIKLACQEVEFTRAFTNVFGYASRASASLGALQVLPGSLLVLLGQLALLALAAILWSSGLSQGAIAGQMALVVLVTSRVIPAANRFFGLFSSMWNMLPWVEEVILVKRELDGLNSETRKQSQSVANEAWQALALDNVTFYYPQKAEAAVSGISLEICRGRLYGLVGISGSGKSTLVDLIIGLYQPKGGDMRLDGVSLRDVDVKTWQRQIGYVPQSPYIADDTLKANVALGIPRAEISDERVRQSLQMANLAEFVETLPEGLNTPVGDRGIRMSGGQRQRLAIARAFYQNPQLLVLDEATSSLDTISEKEVQQAVGQLKGKVTMLVIAHRLSTVRDCDEIFYMEHGRLEARGTFDELLSKCEGFRMLAAQLGQETR